ncbi:hypothetical protein VTK73DRAFT_10246 [Phialemonium thermophilum]|uniref:Zn(2)-C6 fungal-type domain-containing protein n=1 Tax=Phialemonium thermophilum TaxID=223376 RepID=A0ABR3VXS1_9PEZI
MSSAMEQGPRPTRRRNGGVPSTTPSASSSPQPRAARGGRAQRGLTCANCRARKTRCDGTQPSCKTCEVYHDQRPSRR